MAREYGLHGIHVVAGMIVIVWMMLRTRRNEFSPEYYSPIDVTALYWHFVDIVWIFLLSSLYLLGNHTFGHWM